MRRHLFALAWADAKVTGDAERKSVTFRLRAKALDYIHPSQFLSVRKSVSPSRGAGGTGVAQRLWARFGELVCRGV